jgi:regulator of RNase E activity RraA
MPNRYDIGDSPSPISSEVVELLSRCETATIGHWRQWGFCDRRIQSVLPGRTVVGRAITVALPGPCSTLLHYAIDAIAHGDILIVDRLGDDRYACWGGGVSIAVKTAGGIAGVIDGPCTDIDEIAHYDLPVWSRGCAPITTGKHDLGGRLNRPVSVGGAVVHPGDYVLCDGSGVLVLPPHEAEAEARRALEVQEKGAISRQRVIDGTPMSEVYGARAVVERALAEGQA